MAAYLYNIPKIIRPYVTGKTAISQPFKRNDCVWITLVRNNKGIPITEALDMKKAGFIVSQNYIEFQRHPSSVK